MLKFFALGMIKFYQIIFSPDHGFSRQPVATCRFLPTCSEYTFSAIKKYGFFRGMFLGSKRICKCHPWHQGGYDPLK